MRISTSLFTTFSGKRGSRTDGPKPTTRKAEFLNGEIRGIIFDLDNTLLRSRRGALRGLRVASKVIAQELRRRGLFFSEFQILARLRRIERERRAPISGLVPQRLYDRDVWWKILLRQLNLTKFNGPWVHRTTARYWGAYAKTSPPFRDAEATVRRLKRLGYRLAIVSDSDGTPGVKRERIRRVPFSGLFETAVVAGEDTPRVKPTKAPFLMVAKRLGLSPRNCVYVGDNPDTDVAGARAAGMLTVLVRRPPYGMGNPGPRVERERPTLRILSLSELPHALTGLVGEPGGQRRLSLK